MAKRLPKREQVPLRMIEGNISILLEHMIPCTGISLMRDPETANGVLLMVHGANKEIAEQLGFKLGSSIE